MLISSITLGALLLATQSPEATAQFDWTIAAGETFIFDTVSTTITSTPPTHTQTALNGFVDVRNFTIEEGGKLVVEGPNAMVISASGVVAIDGRLSINGQNSNGAYPMTNQPSPGAKGHGGGGDGGDGSPFTTLPSPIGGTGLGAFAVPGVGGRGGQAGWATYQQNYSVAGGGGGGGVFALNQSAALDGVGPFDQSQIGLDAEHGFFAPGAFGAVSGPGVARGGSVGVGPFTDSNPANDFFGTAIVESTGELIIGELPTPWAGAGGGGGGDATRDAADQNYPPHFSTPDDEAGAGGGGGAGSLRIRALGAIVFGPNGVVTAKGGNGNSGAGGRPFFVKQIGGASGGGSGGHLILETADHIDLSQVTTRALLARGGQGGAAFGQGGAMGSSTLSISTQPRKDACPEGYPTSGPNSCIGHSNGAGGDGGPGVIQLHTPGGLSDILLATGRTLADLASPRPVCWDSGCRLLLTFDDQLARPARSTTPSPFRTTPRSIEVLRMSGAR